MEILGLSYQDLPGYLKPCFLYLGFFPEDFKIPAEKLIRLWIAEGFIQRWGRESKEAAAEDCFEDLVRRSMIQVADWEYDGTIVSCHVHDLLRELAVREAKQQHLFEIDGNLLEASTSPPSALVLRLGIHGKNDSLHQRNLPKVRSLLCFTESIPRLLVVRAKWLRVLDFEGHYKLQEFPDVFESLVHLKYLNLRGQWVRRLPPTISKLYFLETFICDFVVLPAPFWTMRRLRHLLARGCSFDGHSHLGRLKHLHTLDISAGDWIEEESLMELSELRKFLLTGSFVEYRLVLASTISKMVNLEMLHLFENVTTKNSVLPPFMPFTDHLRLRDMSLRGFLERLPESHEFPPNLTKLEIELGGLKQDQDPMLTLEKLKNLRMLLVGGWSCPDKKMISSTQGFPQLRELSLHSFGFEEWMVERGAFPALKSLQIRNCMELKMLPEGLQDLTTLQHLYIDGNGALHDRVQRETGADWYKIQHIPHVFI